ncbi:MAG TPA: hypothetical protein VK427_07820, partial [Kofleriaceae bacterium]|nr:hypothetical protein [Kofleriaceae bacterium]
VVVADVDLEIVDDVTFVGAPRALTISTRSLRALDALAHTLREDPGIARVEVQAATADAAQLCIDYLIGQGVDPARLAAGLHDTRRRAPTVAFRPDSQP